MRQSRKEIDLWQAEGGLLITFSGNETFAESQRSAFKEAPVDFLKNILDEETTSRLLAKRNTNYQKYYTISDLLENTKIRNRPNTVLYGGLIPSRLHHLSEETVLERLMLLKRTARKRTRR